MYDVYCAIVLGVRSSQGYHANMVASKGIGKDRNIMNLLQPLNISVLFGHEFYFPFIYYTYT